MNTQADIHVTTIELVPIKSLDIAPENPRSDETISDTEIDQLADSIFTVGLLTPLIGYAKGKKVMVVAGGRRTRALHRIASDKDRAASFDGIVPVRMIDPAQAAEHGIVEQLMHAKLTDSDHARAFYHLTDKGLPVETISKMLGLSQKKVAAIAQTAELPEEYREMFMRGELTLTHAVGLLLWKDDLDGMNEIVNEILRYPDDWRRHSDFQQALENQHQEWSRCPYSAFVSQDEYTAAGGELQKDLLSDAAYILQPSVLIELAKSKIAEKIEADYGKDYGFIEQREANQYGHFETWDIPKHPGFDGFTDEEREWWHENRYQWNFESDEEKAAHKARVAELESKAKRTVPPGVKKLCGVVWAITPRSTEGFTIVENALPANLEPLYEAGYLDRPDTPKDAPDTSDEAEKPSSVSGKLQADIYLLKLHIARQELAKDRPFVLRMTAGELTHHEFFGHASYGHMTDANCVEDLAIDPDAFTRSKEWEDMKEVAARGKAARKKLSATDSERFMAYALLRRITQIPVGTRLTKKIIRTYYTPCEMLLGRYKTADLRDMLDKIMEKGEYNSVKMKKTELVRAVAKSAAKTPDWLPPGF